MNPCLCPSCRDCRAATRRVMWQTAIWLVFWGTCWTLFLLLFLYMIFQFCSPA